MALAIGNECIPSFNEQTGILEYNGMSPDDIELVKTSSEQGYTMLKSPNGLAKKYGKNDGNEEQGEENQEISEEEFQKISNRLNKNKKKKNKKIILNNFIKIIN